MNPTTMTCSADGIPIITQQEYSSYFIVHRDHAGFLIGANGATIKNIAHTTNTWIHIQPPNEWSFGHPWFIIKGRSVDVVSAAYHYIAAVANEAEFRNPRWYSETLAEELSSEDIANIDEFYNAIDAETEWTEHIMWKELIIANEIETDRVSTFNATLTDFEFKDLEKRLYKETAEFTYVQLLPPCSACEYGIENQQGHYGLCMPDPYSEDQTVSARAVCQLDLDTHSCINK